MLNRPTSEEGATIIDELIVLFKLYEQDDRIIDKAMKYIAQVRKRNPQHPITVRIANLMREKKLID